MRAEEQAVLVNACSSIVETALLPREAAFAIVRLMSRLVTLFRVHREIGGRSASTAVRIPERSSKVRAWRSACQALDVPAQWLIVHTYIPLRHLRRCVSENLLDYLTRHASGCERARRGVAKIVEAEAACDACDPFRAHRGASERNFRNAAAVGRTAVGEHRWHEVLHVARANRIERFVAEVRDESREGDGR